MDMHMQVRAWTEALARVELCRSRALRGLRSSSIKSGQRLSQDHVDLSGDARVAMDEVAQTLGKNEHPLPVRDIRQKVVKRMSAFHDRKNQRGLFPWFSDDNRLVFTPLKSGAGEETSRALYKIHGRIN